MFDMKYLCFLAYLLINLVNCRFFVTSDYSLQKQVQYILFLFLCSRFHKSHRLSLHISVSSSNSMAYYIGGQITHNSKFHLQKARQWCQKCLKKQLLAPLSALFRDFPSFFHYFRLSLQKIKEMKICCKISLEENGKLS